MKFFQAVNELLCKVKTKAETLAEFEAYIKESLGKQINGGQCVGLYRHHIAEWWKLPNLEGLGATEGAHGLYNRYETDVGPLSRRYLERITYTQGSPDRPCIGDAVVLGPTDGNRHGHVGMFAGVTVCGMIILFDQNGLAQPEENRVARLSTWPMANVLGWLRKRE